ncbi:MAG: hypothetical protein KDH96_03795 [Candidatus Riesia sp.]|nr:hypothetical protein [Candidatus Riesia sp.]
MKQLIDDIMFSITTPEYMYYQWYSFIRNRHQYRFGMFITDNQYIEFSVKFANKLPLWKYFTVSVHKNYMRNGVNVKCEYTAVYNKYINLRDTLIEYFFYHIYLYESGLKNDIRRRF